MKIRKIVAGILAAAMVLTSSAFSTTAYAAEIAGNDEVSVSVENSESLTAASEAENETEITVEETNGTGFGENQETEISETETSEIEESGNTGSDEVDVAEETSDEDAEVLEETGVGEEVLEESGEELLEESDVEVLEESDEEILEDADAEELTDEEASLDEDEDLEFDEYGNVLLGADDYFVRGYTDPGTGKITLKLKDGVSLASTVTIPWNTQVIPADIFRSNSTVKKVQIESRWSNVDQVAKLEKIEAKAFESSSLEEIDLPVNVQIGEGAFKNSALKTLNFFASTTEKPQQTPADNVITTIPDSAFQGTKLTSVRFPKCQYIGESAFEGCSNLTSAYLPSIETIEASAFKLCSSLADNFDFTEMPNLAKIGNNAFQGCGFTSIDLSKNTKLKSLVKAENGDWDQTNSTLGIAVFADNVNLKDILFVVGNATNITYIPGSICKGCKNLTTINIPLKAVAVGDSAFENCTSLKTINLNKVQFVKSKAFAGCTILADITMKFLGTADDDEESEETSWAVIHKDAFPNKTGVTMRGYNSAVETFAGDMSGYKYVSLYTQHTITVHKEGDKNLNVDLSASKAIKGKKITITVTPSNPFKNIYYTYEGSAKIYPDYVSSDGKIFKYTFIMPNRDVDLYALAFSAKDLASVVLTPDFETEAKVPGSLPPVKDPYSPTLFKWDERGRFAKIKIMGGSDQINNWLFTFKSGNTKVATVDNNGIVTGLMNGTAKITATATWDTKKTCVFYVSVGSDVKILKLENGKGYNLEYRQSMSDFPKSKDPNLFVSDVSVPYSVSVDPVTYYPVITLSKEKIAKESAKLTLSFDAYATVDPYNPWKDPKEFSKPDDRYDENTSYIVSSKWTTTDETIAKPKSSSSVTNSNVINIIKGSEGEAKIAISTLNTGEEKVNRQNDVTEGVEDNLTYFVIRVVDTTPRLGEKELKVNHQYEDGTPLTIVPVYDMEINNDVKLEVVKKRVVNKNTEYYQDKDTNQFAPVEYDSVTKRFYLKTTDAVTLKKGEMKTYKNIFYLKGTYKNAIDGEFYIPIKTLNLVNESPAPKISQSGSINIFYNYNAAPEDKGKVTVTQSLKKYTVESYALVSSTNKKNPGTESSDEEHGYNPFMVKDGVTVPFDSLWYNFNIDFAVDKYGDVINNKAVINLTPETATYGFNKVSKKAVVSGYLKIKYLGYKDPVYVAITIKTVNKAPQYLLSQTSATACKGETGQAYKLYMYEKGKKNKPENAISLSNTYELDTHTGKYNYYINYEPTKTKANFSNDSLRNKDVLARGELEYSNSRLLLKVPDGFYPQGGKARIAIHMTTWADKNKYLYYDFNLKTVDAAKAVFVDKKSTLNLNKAYISTGAGSMQQLIEVTTSVPDDAEIEEFTDLKDSRSKKEASILAYDTLETLMGLDVTGGVGNIHIIQPGSTDQANKIPNGKYKFSVVPKIKYIQSGNIVNGARINFTVNVTNKKPTLTLGKITLSSHNRAVKEMQQVSVKMGNLLNGTYPVDYAVGFETDASFTKSKTKYAKGDFDNEICYIDYGKDNHIIRDSEYSGHIYGSYDKEKEKWTGYWVYATPGLNDQYFVKADAGKYKSDKAYVIVEGNKAELASYTVNLASTNKDPAITLKASGSINLAYENHPVTTDDPTDPDYDPLFWKYHYNSIAYKTTLKNINGTIRKEVGVYERDANQGGRYVPSRFAATYDVTTGKTYLYLRPRAEWLSLAPYANDWSKKEITAGKTYTITLFYGVSSMSHYNTAEEPSYGEVIAPNYDIMVKDIKVTPKNSFPAITAKSTNAYAYAGQERRDKTWDILVTGTVNKSYWLAYDKNKNGEWDPEDEDRLTMNQNLVGVDWGKSVSQKYKDEFEIITDGSAQYDPLTGEFYFYIRLKNAAEQVQNKTYTLKFAPLFAEEQSEKRVKGKEFTVDVNVRK